MCCFEWCIHTNGFYKSHHILKIIPVKTIVIICISILHTMNAYAYIKVYCYILVLLPFQSMLQISSLLINSYPNPSSHLNLWKCLKTLLHILDDLWVKPLPLMFDLIRVSVSSSSLTSAAACNLLVLYRIMMGHSRLGWSSSSPYTVQTNNNLA